MNCAKKHLNSILAILILCLCISAGCSSMTNPTPDIIESETISYDEYGKQTSGIISVSDDKTGFIVTQHFIDRYNDMVKKYGEKFSPAIEKNYGVSKIEKTYYYFMTNQAMAYFLTLNDYRRLDTRATFKD